MKCLKENEKNIKKKDYFKLNSTYKEGMGATGILNGFVLYTISVKTVAEFHDFWQGLTQAFLCTMQHFLATDIPEK